MRRGTANDASQDCDGQLRRQATFAVGDRVKCTAPLDCRDSELRDGNESLSPPGITQYRLCFPTRGDCVRQT